MTHNELRYIITIYDEGNFSQAAKKLYISQPALSQSIHKVESELGVRLFTRSNAGSAPTAFCQKLVEDGRDVLKQWDHFMVNMKCMAEDMHATLEVGMCTFLVRNLLPYVLPVFEQRYPHIKLKIVEERTRTLEQFTLEGVINLCIEMSPSYNSSLARLPLCSTELLLAVPSDHPFCLVHPYKGLRHLERVDLKPLRGETFALLKHRTTEMLWNGFYSALGCRPTVRQAVQWTGIKKNILQESCVGFLDELFVRNEAEDERISYYRVPAGLMPQTILATFVPGKRLSPQEQCFMDVVKEVTETRTAK